MISPQNIPNAPQDTAQSSERRYSFEELIQTTDLPPPGPDHYAARRALWLNPPSPPLHREPQPFSSSRQRLENMLSQPGALTDDDTWKHGIEKVWKVLSAGGKFKRRLPMRIVIMIIHAAWLRDDTWPVGAIAPADSDRALHDIPPELLRKYPSVITGGSSGATAEEEGERASGLTAAAPS